MSDDFAQRVAQRRLAEIDAGRAHANAAWKSAEAENDEYSAVEAYKLISDFNKEEQQVRRDYQQHINSQRPPQPVPQTDAEWMSKAPERMDYADAMKIHQKSRYAGNLDHNDPLVQAGYREVMARRARGE
jgi:hypothetical protein